MPTDERDAAAQAAEEALGLEGPLVLVVMGVSGSGKTTVGRKLAERFGWSFFEGDDLHPDANVEKMKAGEPLADSDRQPWLEEIRDLVARLLAEGSSGVIACSALKLAYRDLIREAETRAQQRGARSNAAVRFVYLDGSYEQIEERLAERDGHYMPTSLLDSQFDALEEPGPDENALYVGIDGSPEATMREAVRHLRAA